MLNSLSFKDKALEEEFIGTRQGFHLVSFRNLMISLVFQASTIYFSNPIGIDIFEMTKLIPFIIAMFLTILFYFIVTRKFAKKCSLALSAFVCFYILGASEFANYLQKQVNLESWAFFLLGISIQTGCLFLPVSRIKWTHSLFIISVVNIFSWIRIIDVFHNSGAQKVAIASMITNISLLVSITYSSEQGDRSTFQRLKLQNMQLEALEELIKRNIPTGIIVLEKDDVLFTNDGAKNMLDIVQKAQVIEILRRIKVISQDEKNKMRYSKNIETERSYFDKTLYELIKVCEKSMQNGKLEICKTFSGVEGEINNELSETPVSFSCQIGPILWKGKPSVVVILSDISFIKNHYKSLDIYKDNLLATVSHDLRTPLNGMLGMLELLLEECLEESQREKLNVTISSAKLLHCMINDILDFSLVSKGKLRLKFESTNVASLVEETIKILRLNAKLKGLDIVIHNQLLSSDSNHIIDGNRVRQVLLNLLGNAIKFTEFGKITVRLREEVIDDGVYISCEDFLQRERKLGNPDEIMSEVNSRKRLFFEVEDTGIGIKKSEMGKLFKLYSRISPQEGQNTNGIGLGLAISQSLVRLMNSNSVGADITVSSEFGRGSTFSFPINLDRELSTVFEGIPKFEHHKMPLSLEPKTLYSLNLRDLSPVSHLASEGDWLISHGKRHTNVLVVDDDQINILVAISYLNSFGNEYQISTAKNGKEAVDKVFESVKSNKFFDIILMDCNMPVMDGYEASEKIKAMISSNFMPFTPIVAITANVGSSDKEKCFAHGMDFFLTKPYSKIQLLKTMQDALKNN